MKNCVSIFFKWVEVEVVIDLCNENKLRILYCYCCSVIVDLVLVVILCKIVRVLRNMVF